jgi:hypothetical protein
LSCSGSPTAHRVLWSLSFLVGACGRSQSTPAPPASTEPPASLAPPAASTEPSSEPAVDAAPAALDLRPKALRNLVAIDDPDAGNAAPTGEVADCEERLAQAGVTFRRASLPVHTKPGSRPDAPVRCGAPQVVTYVRGPGAIAYDPSPTLTCAMALALASFEHIVQDEAERTFHSPVTRIEQIGTYNCRDIVAVKGLPSEHSFANAIDLTRFTMANGKTVAVLADFDAGEAPPARPAGAFLRAVSERAHYENVFSNVLTPFWDPAHKNHFHLDLARYRVNGVRRREP